MNTTSNANLKNPPFVSTQSNCSSPAYGGTGCGNGGLFIDGFGTPVPTNIATTPGASIPDAVSPELSAPAISSSST